MQESPIEINPKINSNQDDNQNCYLSIDDGDIILIDDTTNVVKNNFLKVDYVIVIVCYKGRISFRQDGETVEIGEKQVYICQPGSVLDDFMVSIDMRYKALCFRRRLFDNMLFIDKQLSRDLLYIHKHPVFNLSRKDIDGERCYYQLIREKLMESEDCRFRREILHGLLTALSLQLFSIVEKQISNLIRQEEEKQMVQDDSLVRHFVELVHEHEGHIRSVREFAKLLNVSPKYLSSMVSKHTGRHAYDFVREATALAVEHRLRYTDMSVKEISNEFHFPNLSFFGRFVKAKLGVSPTIFRKNLRK